MLIMIQSFVSAKFNRRAALTKYHKDASDATTKPNDSKEEQPTADSTQQQNRNQGLLDDKLTWKRIHAAAIKRRKLTTDKRRQKMLDLIGKSNDDNSKYKALLQRLLNEENERRQANKRTEKSLHYALYGMNLI